MTRVLARPVRGKCRQCDTSVQQAQYGWIGEHAGPHPYECPAAAPVTCPACDGVGELPDDDRNLTDDDSDDPVICPNCVGVGEVPGPHWPWRHPPTL